MRKWRVKEKNPRFNANNNIIKNETSYRLRR